MSLTTVLKIGRCVISLKLKSETIANKHVYVYVYTCTRIHGMTDGRTDEQTNGQTSQTTAIGIFFEKKY